MIRSWRIGMLLESVWLLIRSIALEFNIDFYLEKAGIISAAPGDTADIVTSP